MADEIKVPVLPESVADATIATWHKKVGEPFKRDENLVDIETDKVMLEIPATADGVLEKILQDTGAVVKAQQVIATFKPSAGVQEKPVTQEKPQASKEKVEPPKKVPARAAASDLSPAMRRAAAGREGEGVSATSAAESRSVRPTQTTVSAPSPVVYSGEREEKRVPMTRLRARIAERLLSAQHNAAILTTFNEVNLQAVMDMRVRYKEQFEKKHGVRLGLMSFFTKATIEALKRFPAVNASIEGNDIVYHGYFDIGVAVSTDRGLVVPVIRNADQMSFADLERNIAEYGGRARDGQITLEEMTGGTFTITNGGVFGSLLATPILNPPQSGILGMHKIEERPIVENGQIVIRPMMYIALSYDHRIIDGKESVQFLVAVKQFLEDPSRLLLDL